MARQPAGTDDRGDVMELLAEIAQRRASLIEQWHDGAPLPWGMTTRRVRETEEQAKDAFGRIFGPHGITLKEYLAWPASEEIGKPIGAFPTIVEHNDRMRAGKTIGQLALSNTEGLLPVLANGVRGMNVELPCWERGEGQESITPGEPPCQESAVVICSDAILCERHWRLLNKLEWWAYEYHGTVGIMLGRSRAGVWELRPLETEQLYGP